MAIATVDELKSHLASKVGAGEDAALAIVLASAEAFVSRYTGRLLEPAPALDGGGGDTAAPIVKTVMVRWGERIIRIPDLRQLVKVTLGGSQLFEGNYMLGNYSETEPTPQIELLRTAVPAYNKPETKLEIEGKFGFNPCPPDLKDAALTVAARRWRERDAAFSDNVQLSEGGVLTYFRSLPSNVQLILKSYKMPRIALVGGVDPSLASPFSSPVGLPIGAVQ